MNIDAYLTHIPTIENAIRAHRLDTIVCGLGPTAWLLPWIDQSVLSGLRMFGCHDGFRIMPMDDLVVMDSPVHNLNSDSGRHRAITTARPKRLWIYDKNAPSWERFLAPCMKSVTKTVPWVVCRPNTVNPQTMHKLKFDLTADPPHTTTISPTGTTTLAWREGCRRIGVVGVDMMKNHHHTYQWWPLVDTFFAKMADQAHALGGCVVNLSPITSLKRFREWKPSTSTLAPTDGKKPPEPSESLSTASASTPPAT